MELTIAPQSYQPDDMALTRAIYSAAAVLARCVTAEQEIPAAPGASAFVVPDRDGIRAVNFAASVGQFEPDNANASAAKTSAATENPTAVIQAIDDFYAVQNTTCQVLYARDAALSEPLANAAVAAGYQAIKRKIFLLANYRQPEKINENVQVVPARAIYPQLPDFYQHMAVVEHHASPTLAANFASTMVDFLDDSRLEMLVARIDGKNLAAAGVLSLGQIGVIIPAWSDPDARGKGVAKTLMTHLLDLCARSLFTQVILDRSEHCTAVPFYESLGFNAVTEFVKYRRAHA